MTAGNRKAPTNRLAYPRLTDTRTHAVSGLCLLALAATCCTAAPAKESETIQDVLPLEQAQDKAWFKTIHARNPAALADGFLDVTLYDGWQGHSVDPTGTRDSTQALQKAIVDARDAALVAFFPEGTYLVSDTLNCMKRGWRMVTLRRGKSKGKREVASNEKHKVIVLIGSTKGKRPLLKLRDNAPGFNNKEDPKPVVIVWNQSQPDRTSIPCKDATIAHGNGFNMVFRGIDIDIGRANPGAVGLCMTGAQGASIEDVKVNATGGFAGFYYMPGAGAGTAHIEVIGGDYGFYGAGTPCGHIVAGIFRDQTIRSIHSYGAWHIGFVGCRFVKNEAPILTLQECDWNTVGGSVFFKDCSIEITGDDPKPVIDNGLGKMVYLKDVYVKAAGHLIRDRQTDRIPCDGQWTHVREFASLPSPKSRHKSDVLVNGTRTTEPWLEVGGSVSAPPADLLSRHVWTELPSFEDADAKNVKDPDIAAKGDGKTDDTQALQKAIDAHRKVFLPKGTYRISGTLTLKKDTVFFGSTKAHAIITNDENWHPPVESPMITTVDDAEATTFLGNIQFHLCQHTPANDKVTMLHWRAGRHSMVKSTQDQKDPFERKGKTAARFYRISGNGGGRWYFWTSYQGRFRVGETSEKLRYMLIENTREPLTFYGFNPEHSGAALAEIRNAKNIDILNTKVEQGHISIEIFDSENINIIGFGGHAKSRPGRGVIEINNSRNITAWSVGGSAFKAEQKEKDFYCLVERFGGKEIPVPDALSLYKRQ
ncbi:MAG: hypothetical protein JXR37_28330 [Kiritimatiellae bacterium]|nr:hypothetical protein [Kiritimatiellia bacterium]